MAEKRRKKSNTPHVKAWCGRCRGETAHWLRGDHTTTWSEVARADGYKVDGKDEYQIIECAGCAAIRFRSVEWCSEWIDVTPDGYDIQVPEVRIYPMELAGDDAEIELFTSTQELAWIPKAVVSLYKETVTAMSAGAETLAGGGVRAVVEAICKDQGISKGDLAGKINKLVEKEMLAKPHAQFLHEQRYLGNEALHEGLKPKRQDVLDGLKIVGWLIKTLYVIPKRAERLKKRRAGAGS